MKILRDASEFAAVSDKACVAIGFFDGVHLGHQQILRQTISDAAEHEAASVVVTFENHPASIVAPKRAPSLIQPTAQRLETLRSLGVDAMLLLRFDQELSRQDGEAFIRSGNVELLRKLGQNLGFHVHGLAAVALDGIGVSSTRIRAAISSGDFDAANQMMGRPYELSGTVVKGDQLGRQLGFPTANLDIAGLTIPPNGVYAAHAKVDGASHRAAVNIGVRPTVDAAENPPRVEACLLAFDGDLYGKTLKLTFHRKLRDEQRFDSLDALKEQIARDFAQVRQSFA
jgi:riboflavin kinase/FMN adenylyltransferase